MSDIELVVKLPQDWEEHIGGMLDSEMAEYLYNTIRNNSTPLPKGHGKIVDIGKVIDSKCNECGHIRGVTCTIPCYEVRRMLSDAPIIVEADTMESEEAI